MAALLSKFEYDIFISYRQNDNKYDGWVTQFVENLQKELEATIKVSISVYFDENPHDGLLETHQVDESLARKLRCLIFIPIISQTYCDPESFAWQHEFLVFKKMADEDFLGRYITLPNGNVSSRILPVRIHKLDDIDQCLLEEELGGPPRSVDFIHEAPGVNRPLDSKRDDAYSGENKIIYRDQINKVANSIKEILIGIKNSQDKEERDKKKVTLVSQDALEDGKFSLKLFGGSLLRRNIPQVLLVYSILSIIFYRLISSVIFYNNLPQSLVYWLIILLIVVGIIALALAWMYEFGPEGLIRTRTWESRLNPYPAYKRKPFTGLVTIIALFLIIIMQNYYSSYFSTLPVSSTKNSKVVAVLPFENLSENGENEYFSTGLTLEITSQLSKIAVLTVIPYASIKKYKDDPESIHKLAKDLGVTAVLTGSVRKDREKVRITTDLIDAQSKHSLWSEIFDRKMAGIIEVQSEMAKLIANVLEAQLSESEISYLEKKPTDNIAALEHYMKGRNYYYKYQKEANDSAVLHFKAAIQLDSNYASAWSGLGDAYSQMNRLWGLNMSWNDSSIIAGTRAIKLDSNSAEAYKALANAYYYANQYDEAISLLNKAVHLSPNYGPAVGNLGSLYFTTGDYYNALIYQRKSAELNPGSFIPPYMSGWIFRLLGDLNNAETWLKKSIEVQPFADVYRELGYTYVQQNKRKEALALLPKILVLENVNSRTFEQAGLLALFANELDSAKLYFTKSAELNDNLFDDPNTIAPLVLAFLSLTNENEEIAIKELKRLNEFYEELILADSDDDDLRIYLAGIQTMLGDNDKANLWISRAIDFGWNDIAMIEYVPWFKELRDNPEYKKTVAELTNRLQETRTRVNSLN